MPLEGKEPPALLQPPSTPHRGLGGILASGLGMSQIQALPGGRLGWCWPRSKLGLLGTVLSARLPEELVRAAAFQGSVPGGECCLFHARATAAKERCPGEGLGQASWGLGH